MKLGIYNESIFGDKLSGAIQAYTDYKLTILGDIHSPNDPLVQTLIQSALTLLDVCNQSDTMRFVAISNTQDMYSPNDDGDWVMMDDDDKPKMYQIRVDRVTNEYKTFNVMATSMADAKTSVNKLLNDKTLTDINEEDFSNTKRTNYTFS